MNKEKPIRDQAERLRKRVERKAEAATDKRDALPPRSELHRKKQKKTNVKIKYPVIRLMALLFILLPVTFFIIISNLEGGGSGEDALNRAGIEFIDVKGKSDKASQSKEEKDVPAMKEIEDDDQLDVAAPASSGEGASIEGKEGSSDSPDKDGEKATDSTAGKEKPAESNPAENRTDAGQVSKPAEDQSAAEETIIYHTVQPKETLFRVAMKYYNSQEGIAIIRKANNLQGNDIQAGQVLKIPLKK